jgi:hypothetical protein
MPKSGERVVKVTGIELCNLAQWLLHVYNPIDRLIAPLNGHGGLLQVPVSDSDLSAAYDKAKAMRGQANNHIAFFIEKLRFPKRKHNPYVPFGLTLTVVDLRWIAELLPPRRKGFFGKRRPDPRVHILGERWRYAEYFALKCQISLNARRGRKELSLDQVNERFEKHTHYGDRHLRRMKADLKWREDQLLQSGIGSLILFGGSRPSRRSRIQKT